MNALLVSNAVVRRRTATLVAAVLLVALLPATARAAHTPNHGDPCREATPATFFADYDRARRVHRASIDCAFYRAITSGAGTNSAGQPIYRPRAEVTRAQMAQFVVNTLIAAGYDDRLPGGGGPDQFDDITTNFARVAINRLARAGIVTGTAPRTYSPNGRVTRQQMASFIVQAANFAVNPDISGDGSERFTDVSATNVHKRNIENGADVGLFQGTSATTFAPGRLVVRDQMATFLVNLLRYIFDEARAPLPFTAQVRVDNATIDAGQSVTGQVAGSNLRSSTISGCGIATQTLTDTDAVATGIQFSVPTPSTQPVGTCTLTFVSTFANGGQGTTSVQMTIRSANRATATVAQSSVQPGGQVTGEITGNNLASARVSGCGLTNEVVEDRSNGAAGIQFSETIPSTQTPGTCQLTFRVTYTDNRVEDLAPQTITVGSRPGVTTRPELVAAQILSTTTTAQATGSNPAGTLVRYFFDEAVSGPVVSRFTAYRFDGTRLVADSVQLDAGATSVTARFGTVNTAVLAADLTTAGVDDAAVTDAQGQQNPEGSASITAATASAAGTTAAPDLLTVGGFRAGSTANTTAVDFTFDEAAFSVSTGGFHLVLTDNRVVDCNGPAPGSTGASGTNVAGGSGTVRLTVICPNPAGTTLSSSTVARGYVDPRVVSDAQQVGGDPIEGNANALQAAAVGSGGSTSGPDLTSVLLTPGATAAAADVATFVFDESVDTDVVASRFVVYDPTGREFTGLTAQREGGGGNSQRRVVVTFAANAFDAVAGASVRDSAVDTGGGGAAVNRADELGIAGPAPTGTAGRTDGPDLVSVAVATTGSGGSQVTTATYTFDETLNTATGASTPSRFFLYLSNGTQLTCAGVAGSTFTISQSTVTCRSFTIAGTTATAAQIASAILGTVDYQAVEDADPGTRYNPEGAARVTGGTGTPAQ